MNKNGFSMMELMVTVAILAVLALVAIPAYQGFQAKARQKEGFHLSTTFFIAAQATHTEFGHFPGDLVQTGFQPQGEIRYRLSSQDGTLIPTLPNDDTCLDTSGNCTCAGACPNYKEWAEVPGVVGSSIGAGACNLASPCGPGFTTDDTFQVFICGVVNTRATLVDQYALNHQKVLTLCTDGLK